MKRLIIAAVATATLALGACATATPYQPLTTAGTASGGFSERPLEANRWQVSFSGNSLTDRRTVETYLLYRAAELTLQQGYDWFSVVDRHTERDRRIYADPFYDTWGYGGWGPSWRLYHRGRWGGWGPWGYWGGWGRGAWGPSSLDFREVTSYEANAEIFLGRGPKPADDRRAFDARQVVDRLNSQVIRPTAAR